MPGEQRFIYNPDEYERERAANSYLMSLIALMAGLPLPIVNLIASLLFYLNNRKSTYYVRWHCTQALLIQANTLVMNGADVTWTLRVIFGTLTATTSCRSYVLTVVVCVLVDFIG